MTAFWGPCEQYRVRLLGSICRGAHARTLSTRAGLSPTRLSKMLRSPDIESETMLSSSVHVLPTCWWATLEPSDQVTCAFFVSTSPVHHVNTTLAQSKRWAYKALLCGRRRKLQATCYRDSSCRPSEKQVQRGARLSHSVCTHDTTSVWALSKFPESIASLPVVHEDFEV